MATKSLSLRARWKCCLWLTRTKTPAHWPRKMKHNNAQQKGNRKIILHVGGSCFEYSVVRWVCDSTCLHRNPKKGIRLFNKSNGVNLMCRRFIYFSMELWKVPWQGHFIFVIFIDYTTGSVLITAVRWPSLGKFVFGLTEILFVANHTSRYTNTIVCACQFLVEWEGFSFAHCLWNAWQHTRTRLFGEVGAGAEFS